MALSHFLHTLSILRPKESFKFTAQVPIQLDKDRILITSDNLAMAFPLANRIGVVAIDRPGCRFSYLITFDSSGGGSKESSFIVTATTDFHFCAFQQILYYVNN